MISGLETLRGQAYLGPPLPYTLGPGNGFNQRVTLPQVNLGEYAHSVTEHLLWKRRNSGQAGSDSAACYRGVSAAPSAVREPNFMLQGDPVMIGYEEVIYIG